MYLWHSASQPTSGPNLHPILQIIMREMVGKWVNYYCTSLSLFFRLSVISTWPHTLKETTTGRPMREHWVRNTSFVVPILCAVNRHCSLAPVLGHICHLLPLTLSNNIIFLFSATSKCLQIPKRVCKVKCGIWFHVCHFYASLPCQRQLQPGGIIRVSAGS